MIKLSYEDIIKKINAEKNIPEEDIILKIKKKQEQLTNLVSRDGAAHIVANEYGVQVFEDIKSKIFSIAELESGMRNVSLQGKILRKYETRHFKTDKREGMVARFLVADSTSSSMIVVWDTNTIAELEKLNENDVIKLTGCNVRDNNGFKEIHLASNSRIELLDIDIDISQKQAASVKEIAMLKHGDVASVSGAIVQAFEPRFYHACPDCGKKVQQDADKQRCLEHGIVAEKYMPVVNVAFDDGTGNIRIAFFRENASGLFAVDDLAIFKDNPVELERLRRLLLGRLLCITGRVANNEMYGRFEMNASSFSELDPKEIARSMLGSL